MILWNDDGRLEEIGVDDSVCFFQQLRVDFKVYNPNVKPLKIEPSTFDFEHFKGCFIGPNGSDIRTKESTFAKI